MPTPSFDFKLFQTEGENFLTGLVHELEELGIPARFLFSDHLCFRVSSLQEYAFYKDQLLPHAELLTEAMVNGRPICTFKLDEPFQTDSHTVKLLELPAPKPGTLYDCGFEHAEFVISESFETFAARFPQLHFKHPGKKTLNLELCLELVGKQAKFHHHSLEQVIEIEEANIRHIIFDFDGTLIKSREAIYEINRRVFSKILNREVSPQEAIEKFHPEFSKLFEAFGVSCPIRKAEANLEWSLTSDQLSYELFDGVRELLLDLKERGFTLHLWTARDERSARKILQDHRLEDFFLTLSFATEVKSKPHSSSLRFDWKSACNHQILVIGDSPSDMIGSKNIQALAGAALWDPHAKPDALIAAGADLFFHHVEDIRSYTDEESIRELDHKEKRRPIRRLGKDQPV